MKFKPVSREELAKKQEEAESRFLWPAGEYDFEVMNADDAISKKGNEMIVLDVNAYNTDGEFLSIKDYLMEVMEFKLRHAAESMGLLEKYEAGELEALDFQGKTGRLRLKVGKKVEGYKQRNEIADYIVPLTDEQRAAHGLPKKPLEEELNDEIPFD